MLKNFRKSARLAFLVCALASPPAIASAADISGAGATFPYPVYAKWAEAYKAETGIAINFQSIGSGGGIKQIKAGTVDFGATDKPLDAQELEAAGLAQFPTVMGGVVPVVNIKGLKPGELKLTGPIIARIYLGEITKWNDPAIVALNPGLTLPDRAIAVVYRSDGSGTTFNFTYYLAATYPGWNAVGVNTAVEWPVGIGGKGNDGVTSMAGHMTGSIGYVEYAYALHNNLSYVSLQNRAGKFVEPNLKSFQAAAVGANWKDAKGFHLILADQPGAGSWPMAAATYILVHKKSARPAKTKEVLRFFDWSYEHGDKLAEDLDYVPMPKAVVSLVKKSWAQITDKAGEPVLAPKLTPEPKPAP